MCEANSARRLRFVSVSRSVAWSDFFKPQTKLLQKMPDPAQAQRNTGLGREPALQLSQRQIGLCGHPIHHLTLRVDSGPALAPSLMRHTLSTAVAVPLCRNLLSPPEAHNKTIRKLSSVSSPSS